MYANTKVCVIKCLYSMFLKLVWKDCKIKKIRLNNQKVFEKNSFNPSRSKCQEFKIKMN